MHVNRGAHVPNSVCAKWHGAQVRPRIRSRAHEEAFIAGSFAKCHRYVHKQPAATPHEEAVCKEGEYVTDVVIQVLFAFYDVCVL